MSHDLLPEMLYQVVKLSSIGRSTFSVCSVLRGFSANSGAPTTEWVDAEGHTMHIPDWAWVVAGYTLFIWSSLKWITLSSNTPDMAGAALCYAAWGLLIRVRKRELPAPLSVKMCCSGWFWRSLISRVLRCSSSEPSSCYGAGTFGRRAQRICGSPRHGCNLSRADRTLYRMDFSRSRASDHPATTPGLNHAWLANPGRYVIPDTNWQGGPDQYGTPVHPTRLIWASPMAFEFATPIGGTFPALDRSIPIGTRG